MMPFGLTNTPTTFCILIIQVFREYLNKFIVVYLDEIMVYNFSLKEHIWMRSCMYGHGECEVHPRVKGAHQCKGIEIISWVDQLLEKICRGLLKYNYNLDMIVEEGHHLDKEWQAPEIFRRYKWGNDERSNSCPTGHEQTVWGANGYLWSCFGRDLVSRTSSSLWDIQLKIMRY